MRTQGTNPDSPLQQLIQPSCSKICTYMRMTCVRSTLGVPLGRTQAHGCTALHMLLVAALLAAAHALPSEVSNNKTCVADGILDTAPYRQQIPVPGGLGTAARLGQHLPEACVCGICPQPVACLEYQGQFSHTSTSATLVTSTNIHQKPHQQVCQPRPPAAWAVTLCAAPDHMLCASILRIAIPDSLLLLPWLLSFCKRHPPLLPRLLLC